MKPSDIIIILAILLVVGAAVAYIVRTKKKGKKCIGCPYADSCSSCLNGCGCSGEDTKPKADGEK